MLFKEKDFERFINKLKEDKVGCNKLFFKREKGAINFRHKGPALIKHDDDFLENLYEHLVCANTMWFDKLTSQFEQIEMEVEVHSDGSIDHNQISFEIKYPIPREFKPVWNAYMLRQFPSIIPFAKFLTDIKFNVHKHELYHVFCYGVISGKEVNKIQRTNSFNKQIAAQWQAAFFKVNEIKNGQQHMIQEMKVVNGQIRPETVVVEQIHMPGYKERYYV